MTEKNKAVVWDTYFARVPYWVFDICTPSEVMTFIALAKFADNTTLECWPSINTLSKLTRKHRTTTIKSLKSLEEKGAIVVTRRPKSTNDNETNLYKLITEQPRGIDLTPLDEIETVDIEKNDVSRVKNIPSSKNTTRASSENATRGGSADTTQTISNTTISNTTISKKNQDFSTSVKETPFYSKDIQTVYVDTLVKAFNLDNITRNKWGQIYNSAKQLFEAEIAPDEIPLLVQNVALTYGEKYTTINSILNHTELLNGVKDKSADDLKEMLNNKELSEWANDS